MNKPSDLVLEYKHLAEVTSTNDYLRSFIPKADITIVSASYQTRGRGQVGNTWVSDDGKNLLFSMLLCPPALRASDGFILSQAMALAIRDVLAGLLDGICVKWPNDIYCQGRKICGTLIENSLQGKVLGRSIIGSGINVNQKHFPDGLAAPATSLLLMLGQETDPLALLHSVVQGFVDYYERILAGDFQRIRELYHQSLYLVGQEHLYADADGVFLGTISHVEPDGHLIISDEKGHLRRYAFKEVSLVHSKHIQ